jgi:hypothetical protein
MRERIPVRTYAKSQLADLYNVHRRTFSRWLMPFIGELEKIGYRKTMQTLPPVIVAFIFTHLGEPETMDPARTLGGKSDKK